jgi:hypothetical protein
MTDSITVLQEMLAWADHKVSHHRTTHEQRARHARNAAALRHAIEVLKGIKWSPLHLTLAQDTVQNLRDQERLNRDAGNEEAAELCAKDAECFELARDAIRTALHPSDAFSAEQGLTP